MIVAVGLTNEFGDSRTIELDVPLGTMTGSRAAFHAEEIANENNPPPNWPVGVPHGTWKWAGTFKRVAA